MLSRGPELPPRPDPGDAPELPRQLRLRRGLPAYVAPIPAAVHIHGGEVPAVLDGGPDSWWTPNGIYGHGFYSRGGVARRGRRQSSLRLPERPGGRADLVPRPHPRRHPPERVRRHRRWLHVTDDQLLEPQHPARGPAAARPRQERQQHARPHRRRRRGPHPPHHPGPDVRRRRPALLPGRRHQPRAPLLDPGIRRRHHRRQRRGLAGAHRPASALPLPRAQRLERPGLRTGLREHHAEAEEAEEGPAAAPAAGHPGDLRHRERPGLP